LALLEEARFREVNACARRAMLMFEGVGVCQAIAPMKAAPMKASPMKAAPMEASPMEAAPMEAAPKSPGTP